MVEVRVNKSLSLHFLFIEELVTCSEVSLYKVSLSSAVAEEQMGLSASFQIFYSLLRHRLRSYTNEVHIPPVPSQLGSLLESSEGIQKQTSYFRDDTLNVTQSLELDIASI